MPAIASALLQHIGTAAAGRVGAASCAANRSLARPRRIRSTTISVNAAPPGGNEAAAGKEQVDAEWAKEVLQEVVSPAAGELGTRGEAWFAAQMIALLLVAFPPGGLRPLVDAIGWLGVAGGLALVFAGQQGLGKNLTPLPKPRENSSLVTTGVYGLCRHPMYGGLVLASLGLSLVLGDELRMVFALVVFVILDRKASYEEQLLRERWGNEYEEYQRASKKLLPYIY